MNYYVIQVFSRSEDKFIRLANRLLFNVGEPFGFEVETRVPTAADYIDLPQGFSPGAAPGRLLWPRRSLSIRHRGRTEQSLAPIFPGYVFYEAEEIHPEVYWVLKQLNGFIRFLKTASTIEPLRGDERSLLLHFLSFGEIVDKSLVYFDESSRIRVVSGPMKGLEGRVVKVDKRKKRAKVHLSMYEERFLVDFGFELLEPVEDHEKSRG